MTKIGMILAVAFLTPVAGIASAQGSAASAACRLYPVTAVRADRAPEIDRSKLREIVIAFAVKPDEVKDGSQISVTDDTTNILQGGHFFAIRKDSNGGYGIFAKGGDDGGYIFTLIPIEEHPGGYRTYVTKAPERMPERKPDPMLYGVCAL